MKPWAFALVLLGLLLLAFPQVLLGLHSFFYRDYGVLGYPFVHYHRESFWNGELPLWNPYSNCGAPFLAQWGTMALYPGSLVYLVLPLPWSLTAFCFLHLVLGGVGMHVLARRWVGDGFGAVVAGVAFVFSGTMFSCLLWPNYTVALGWMPWMVWLGERAWREGGRWVAAAALAGAMQMLAGVPELVLLTWLLLGALWLSEWVSGAGRRAAMTRRLAMVVLLVAGLAAAQLLPFLELLEQSQRDRAFATSKWPMPAWGLANLLVPLFHTRPTFHGPHLQLGQEFFSSYYPGAAVLVLAVLAACWVRERRVWVLAGAVVFAVLMAWGENGLLYPLARQWLPLLGIARYPVKFLLLAAFALPLLAAWAIQALNTPDASAAARRRSLGWAGAVALVLMGFVVWRAWSHPYQSADWSAEDNALLAAMEWRFVSVNALGRAVALGLTLGLLAWLARGRGAAGGGRTRWVAQGAVVGCLFLDILTHTPPQNPSVPSSAFADGLWEQHNRASVPRLGEGRVLISPGAEQRLLYSTTTNVLHDFLGKRLALWSNLNLLDRAPKVNGSSTLQIREQAQVQALLYAGTNKFGRGLVRMLGVTHFSPAENPTVWVPVTNACPLVTCGQSPVFADGPETLRALAAEEFDPEARVFLRPEDQARVKVAGPTRARVLASRFTAHTVTADIEAAEPSLVVVAQSWARGWRATVNGQPALVLRANHAFQAVEVPAGRHEVVLEYRDRRLAVGAMLSLATLAGCGGWWWGGWRRKPAPATQPVPEAEELTTAEI